jgi:hypothetical protein
MNMSEKNAYIDALEQRIAALEMNDMASVTSTTKRYDIPDIEAQKKDRDNNGGDFIRDAIIGFADGLTVPFALTAGLSS